jgi:hypothetical protein
MKEDKVNNIFEPLRLAAGSHEVGSGKGCAMNVISWENGDKKITDFPECSDWFLARIVQTVNDDLADRDGFLSPENSLLVLGLGHATVGTTDHSLSEDKLKRVYVECALYAARKSLLDHTSPIAENGIAVAENWLDNPTKENEVSAKLEGTFNYGVGAASYAALAAGGNFSYARHYAASAVTLVTETFFLTKDRIKFVHEVIFLFKKLTGTDTVVVAPKVTQRALQNMQKVGV